MYSSCHQIVCDSDLSIAPGAASDNFRVVDDPGATSRGSLMRGQKGLLSSAPNRLCLLTSASRRVTPCIWRLWSRTESSES